MLYLLRIASRNLKRNKFRTIISILAISTAVMIVVFARGLINGFLDSTYRLYVDNVSGHVQIVAEEYHPRRRLLTLDYPVDGIEGEGLTSMIKDIREIEGVENILPRLRFGAMATPGEEMVRMSGIGVDPEAEKRHNTLYENTVKGRMVESGREILVGTGLYEKLGINTGERITLVFNDALQSLRGVTFEVVGVFETGIGGFDDNMFYLPLSQAQHMLYMDEAATELLIMGSSTRVARQLEERLERYLEKKSGKDYYKALSWDRTDPMMQTLQMAEGIYDLIYIFFIILGCFVIINTLMMIIKDRTKEIGMMAALGLRRRDIMAVFTMEGAIMGILGSLLGVIPGGILTYYLSHRGLDYYSHLIGEMEDLVFAPVLYPVFSLENLLYSFILGSVITTIACIWPAFKASRLDPVNALREEN